MIFLYDVRYTYQLAGCDDVISDKNSVLAGDDALVAVDVVRSRVEATDVDFSDAGDRSDMRKVVNFRLRSVSVVATVDDVHVPSLVDAGIIMHDDGDPDDAYPEPMAIAASSMTHEVDPTM